MPPDTPERALARLARQNRGRITAEQYQAAMSIARRAASNLRPPVRDEREKRFQNEILKLAAMNGWMAYHVFDSRRSVPGFPDLELVLRASPRRRLIKAELKGDAVSRPTVDQQIWLTQYARVGPPLEVYHWHPEHLERIAEILVPDWILPDGVDPRIYGVWT